MYYIAIRRVGIKPPNYGYISLCVGKYECAKRLWNIEKSPPLKMAKKKRRRKQSYPCMAGCNGI